MADEINHARRGFLRGRVTTVAPPRRPPWSLSEGEFVRACTRCGACAPVCPTAIIVMVSGYPEVRFDRAACTFCGACAEACAPRALRRDGRAAWSIRATVSTQCLAERGVECRACGDPCEVHAIRFSPRVNLPPTPTIVADSCTGCGACVSVCPARAITVR